MRVLSQLRTITGRALVPAIILAAAAVGRMRPATAAPGDDAAARRERCATRLSIALLGESAKPDLLAAEDPSKAVDGMLGEWAFIDRFARFLNATFNDAPGNVDAADAPYFVAARVLRENKPYKDLF